MVFVKFNFFLIIFCFLSGFFLMGCLILYLRSNGVFRRSGYGVIWFYEIGMNFN